MDEARFDVLTRSLAAPSRRSLLALLATAVMALGIGGETKEAAAKPGRHRRDQRRRTDRRDELHEQRKNKKKKKKKKRPSPPAAPPPPTTCAQTCSGCCAGESCQAGTSNDACGAGGALCAACEGATPLCIDQTCQPCDVCGNGCPFNTVQDAIALAVAGETIRICAGSYSGNIVIEKSLTLTGAGDSNGSGSTILRGSGPGSVVQIAAGKTVNLQRLRITGATVGTEASYGGGISNDGGTLTVTGCTVNGNQATYGGGVRNNGGTMHLINSNVVANQAFGGGGIDNTFGGTLHLINSDVTDNQAFGGGGINNSFGSTVTLNAVSRVMGNVATAGSGAGGGINNYDDSTVTLSNEDNVTGNTPENCAGTVPQCVG